jgi:hypothetical protein
MLDGTKIMRSVQGSGTRVEKAASFVVTRVSELWRESFVEDEPGLRFNALDSHNRPAYKPHFWVSLQASCERRLCALTELCDTLQKMHAQRIYC